MLQCREKLGQAVANGKDSSGGPVLTAGLVEDVGKMMGNRFLAESQFFSDIDVGSSSRHQAQHFYLSCSQSGEIAWCGSSCWGSHYRSH